MPIEQQRSGSAGELEMRMDAPAPVRRRSLFGRSVDVDTAAAVAAAALYLVLSAALLPVREYPRALGSGVVVFAAVAGLARRRGRGRVGGRSVLGVGFASMAVLVIPAMGSAQPAAGPLGFLGVQAAMLLWAARRWISRPPPDTRSSLRSAWMAGVIGAAVLCAVAAIPILLELFLGEVGRARILLFYPSYFAGALAAATVYWLLQRMTHLAAGRHLIGLLGGICVLAALGLVRMIGGEPFDLAATVAAGGLIGPPIAFALTSDLAAGRTTETPRGTPAEPASA
jgi:hypothetical protein